MKEKLKKKDLKSMIIKLVLLVIIIGVIYLIFNMDKILNEDKLVYLLNTYKDKALLIYFLVSFAQPICLPLPEAIIVMTGSLVFGEFTAALVGFIGSVLGILTMFLITRYASQKFIKRMVSNEKLDKFNEYIKKNETLIIFLLFIIPILPDEIICIGSGLTEINGYKFGAVAVLAKLVTAFTLAYSIEVFKFSPISILIIILVIVAILVITKISNGKANKNRS